MSVDRLILNEPPLVVLKSLVKLLGDHASAAYLQQVHFRSRTDHDGHKWAVQTAEEWCEDVCLTLKQLRRVVERCVELGIVVRDTVKASSYDQTVWTRVDYVALNALMEGADRGSPNGQPRERPEGQPLHPSRGVENNPSCSSDDERPLSEFNEWWNVWPKKVGRPVALKAYEKARKQGATREQMLDAARAVAEKWEVMPKSERQYIPYPATWLNQQRFLDEPDPTLDTLIEARKWYREARPWFQRRVLSAAPDPDTRDRMEDGLLAALHALMLDGYGAGEGLIRLAIAARKGGPSPFNARVLRESSLAPRFEGRPRRWQDEDAEPMDEILERAFRNGIWVQR